MSNFIYTILFIFCSVCTYLNAQPLYSDYYINPLGTWSGLNGGAILMNDTTYIAGIGGGLGYAEKSIIFGKLNSEGEMVFMKTYGEQYFRYYPGFRGCFRPVGHQNFIFVVAKEDMITDFYSSILYYLNHNFDTLLSKEFIIAEGVATIARQIIPAFDDGYYVTGMHSPLNDTTENSSFFILKTDSVFNIEWQQSYSLTWQNEALYMVKTPDNGLLISGFTRNQPAAYSVKPLVVKADSLGNILWIWNEGSIYDDGLSVVAIAADGNYLAAYTHAVYQGSPYPVPPSRRILRVLKFDPDGEILWENDYGSATDIDNEVTWIHSYDDGTHLIGGYQWADSVLRSKSFILKINDDGDSLWMRYYEHEDASGIAKFNGIYYMNVTPGNGILATGVIVQYDVPGGVQAMWIMHLDSLGCVEKDCDPTVGFPLVFHQNSTGLSVYPNPAKDHITFALENTEHHRNIELRCFNLLGMQQHQTAILRGQQQASANVSAWPPGMYVVVVYSDGRPVGRGKFVVQR